VSDALQVLDVSQLEPPQPLQRALAAMDTLATGACLCLLHRRDPLLLYPILEQRAYQHITREIPHADNATPAFNVYIWRQHDAAAEAAARRALSQLP
jgi:hypothetical protein